MIKKKALNYLHLSAPIAEASNHQELNSTAKLLQKVEKSYKKGNDIRGLFPKDNAEWLNWVNQDKLLYVDKKRVQTLIDQQQTNLAEVDYLDLNSAAKIIQNFENPSISDKNNSDIVMFSENTTPCHAC